jgi:hypothetical protein
MLLPLQFEAKVSARKFRGYKCTRVNTAQCNLEKRVSQDGDVSDTEKGDATTNVEAVNEKTH